jgi:hypothetical protein
VRDGSNLHARATYGTARLPALALTAATTTTAAAATATAATATATAPELLAIFCLVDAQRSAIEHRAVHVGDGLGCLVRIAHRHERETARLSALAVRRKENLADLTEWCEGGADGFGRRAERKIPNVQTISHVVLDSRDGSKKGWSYIR